VPLLTAIAGVRPAPRAPGRADARAGTEAIPRRRAGRRAERDPRALRARRRAPRPVATAEIAALRADLDRTIAELEKVRGELAAIAAVKRALGA
jgi:hypothetical protein